MAIKRAHKVAAIGVAVAALAVPLITQWEGTYTHAYRDIVGVVTICNGITNADRAVHMGDVATVDECKQMLKEDLPKYEAQIQDCVHVTMPDSVHAAMLSLTFNVGGGAFCRSSVARALNAKNWRGACNALMGFTHAGGREVKGLVNRRHAERAMCLRDVA